MKRQMKISVIIIAILAIVFLAGAYLLWHNQRNQYGTGLHLEGTLGMAGVPILSTNPPTLAVATITETGTGRVLYIVLDFNVATYQNFVGDANSLHLHSPPDLQGGEVVWFNGVIQQQQDFNGDHYWVVQLSYLNRRAVSVS